MGLREKAVQRALDVEEQWRLDRLEQDREDVRKRIDWTRGVLEKRLPDGWSVQVGEEEEEELLVDDLKFRALDCRNLYLSLGECDGCGRDIIRLVHDWDDMCAQILAFDRGEISCDCDVSEDLTEVQPLEEIKEGLRCPFFSAGRNEGEPCLEGRCAIWEEPETACAFWLIGRRVAADFIDEERGARRGE